MRGRLNTFQRTMLQWDALHPYNAIHVVRIPRAFDAARLQNTLQTTLETLGLAGLVMDRRTGGYEYRGGQVRCEVVTIAPGENALAAEIMRQLNQPFVPVGSFSPFRFFVAPEADSFLLGVVYFHAIADAESIVRLVQALVRAYLEQNVAVAEALDLHPQRPGSLFFRKPGIVLRKLLALPGLIADMKKTYRPQCRDMCDLTNGFILFPLSSEQLRALIAAGKSWGVSVNDLFLAILLKSFAGFASHRSMTEFRRELSVGCVVNTRRDHDAATARAFGLYLGSFVVTHEVPPAINLRELATDIHRTTQRIKRDRLYLAASVEMALAGAVLAWFTPERRKKVYRKNYPLCGGITNLNLNPLWPKAGAGPSLNYLRAVSTGPVTPLVLSVTTEGDAAQVGLSYRKSFFSEPEIGRIKFLFLEQVEQLKSGG